VERVCYFGHGREDRRGRDGGEETAKRHNGYNDHFAAWREFGVDYVVVACGDVLHIGHVVVADGGDCALELEMVLVVFIVAW
jgi:hypothetical protein